MSLLVLLAGCSGESSVPGAQETQSELFQQITRPGDGAAVHLVRLVQRGDRYSFDPAEIVVRSGDLIRFVMVGQQPESVVFDTVGAAPEVAEFIHHNSLHLGVLLTDPGQSYDVSFRDAPAGRYPFVSLPHAVHGMRGVVDVTE